MRTIKNKLNSERGASLTFALLLFLVCAVVGSAVLVAGTAAAGRMSRIAEMDQRYYSVNSAARLLIELIEKDEVKVIKTTVGDEAPKYSIGDEIGDDYTFTSLTDEAAYQLAQGITEPVNRTVNFATEESDTLNVNMTETIYPDGRLLFVLKNVNGSEQYTINVWFLTEKRQQARELDVSTNTETITTSVKWKLSDVEIVQKPPVSASPAP